MDEAIGYGFAFDNLFNQPFGAVRRNFLPNFKSTHHRHDFPQIWYCYKGHYFHQVAGHTYECAEGSIIVLPIGTPHQFWTDCETELMYINIHYLFLLGSRPEVHKHAAVNLMLPSFFPELGLTFSCYRVLDAESRQVFEQAFSWFALTNYAPMDPAREEQIWDKLEDIFSIPEFSISCRSWKKAMHMIQSRFFPILRIVDYINNHYPEKITNEMLLRVGNISRTAMCRNFRLILESTPSGFLQHLRTRHVHICMRDTTYSLQELAELCGFYDSYHLSRLYSKCTGRTISSQRACIEEHRRMNQISE